MSFKARILLIDDDKTILNTLKIMLDSAGYLVDTAQTGQEAVDKTYANFYNLAIVDWRLPDTEGTKLLRRFRETTPKMMKIMLTGYSSMQNAIDAVNEQADAFVQKPAEVGLLLKKINELIEQQQHQKIFDEQKVAEFIQTKAAELINENKLGNKNF